jgi:hypothetical protein
VRHLNDALGMFLFATALMLVFAAVIVKLLLARKERRKSRGAGYHIDITSQPAERKDGDRLGSHRDRR